MAFPSLSVLLSPDVLQQVALLLSLPIAASIAAVVAGFIARGRLRSSRHPTGRVAGSWVLAVRWPLVAIVSAVWLANTSTIFWTDKYGALATALGIGAAVIALGSAGVRSTVAELHRGQPTRPYALWGTIAQLLVVAVGVLLVLANMGYDVRALLGGLGLGGVAVALAVKDTLADAFGSIAIQTGDIFRIGDEITVGGQRGRVLQIGLKNTRLQSEQGEIIVPNGSLTSGIVINHTRATEAAADTKANDAA